MNRSRLFRSAAVFMLFTFPGCNMNGAGNTTLGLRSDLRLNGFPFEAVDTSQVRAQGYVGHLRRGQRVGLRLEGEGVAGVIGVVATFSPPIVTVQSRTLYDYEITAVGPGEARPGCTAAFSDGSTALVAITSQEGMGYGSIGAILVE
jgi:hypothetical protein